MKYNYWLAALGGLPNNKKIRLCNEGISSRSLYEADEKYLRELGFLTENEIAKIINSRREQDLDQNYGRFQESGISFVGIEEEDYPKSLRHISNPPRFIFYIGRLLDKQEKNAAIVGARQRSAYGSEAARALASRLAENGIGVISGMARGIDADAHIGALETGGRTCAVLGCGVDICYPRENRYLYDKMLQEGCIISEFPPGTPAIPINFPMRNRIISGLSDIVIVIEAKRKSGSLITADFALEQGKDVYALPGRITDRLSEGCNYLIKQGAGIINNIDDFVKELLEDGQNTYRQMDIKNFLLEKDETLVYSLFDFRPLGMAELMDKIPMDAGQLFSIIEKLTDKGFIREIFPNYYTRTI